MHFSTLLFAALPLATTALPHKSIIDTPNFRDVGLIYTGANYTGHSNFLLENRKVPTCYPLNVDGNGQPNIQPVVSVKVCSKTCTCHFFAGSGTCGEPSTHNFVAKVRGPTDIAEFKTPQGHGFMSYKCTEAEEGFGAANFTVKGIPHVVADEDVVV